jgi:thiol-disulfide isomerase/thioredoxin
MPDTIASMEPSKSLHRVVAGIFLASALVTGTLAAGDGREPAPRFSARTLDGERYTNASLAGRPVLIQFWATWCSRCRGDQAAVDAIAHDYADKGLVVLAVDVGESKRTVKSYLERSPRDCKIVLNEDTNLPAVFAARAVPLYVLIDKDGRIAGTQPGAGGEALLRHFVGRLGLE